MSGVKIDFTQQEWFMIKTALVERARMLRGLPESSNPNAKEAALNYARLAEKIHN